jgi:DNA-binding NarL/FixJ family response regulator
MSGGAEARCHPNGCNEPKLNGLEATRLIREKVPQTEAIVLSQHPAQMLGGCRDKARGGASVRREI